SANRRATAGTEPDQRSAGSAHSSQRYLRGGELLGRRALGGRRLLEGHLLARAEPRRWAPPVFAEPAFADRLRAALVLVPRPPLPLPAPSEPAAFDLPS